MVDYKGHSPCEEVSEAEKGEKDEEEFAYVISWYFHQLIVSLSLCFYLVMKIGAFIVFFFLFYRIMRYRYVWGDKPEVI